jgi:D-alanyl-D-alanine carboxypeptidase
MLAPAPLPLRLASISKTVVAMAALRTFDARHLDIDGSVDTWLPDVTDAHGRSLRSLLSHTSGLPTYDRAAGFWSAPNARFTPEQLLAFDRDLPHRPAPAPFAYANTNYVIVGMLLERLEGKPLAEILHAILEPLGLGNLHPEQPGEPVEPTFDEDGRRTGVRARPSMLFAAGDLVAPLVDVVAWTQVWGRGDVVPKAFSDAWLRPTPTREGGDVSYGLGVFLQSRKGLGAVRSHAGNLAGLHAYAAYFPDLDAAIVAIATRDGLDPSRTALDAAERIAAAQKKD